MHEDPFSRFERSRGGLLIPVAVFCVGAFVTLVSIELINRVAVDEQRRAIELDQIAADRQRQNAEAPNFLDPAVVDQSNEGTESRSEHVSGNDNDEAASAHDAGQLFK